MAMIKRFRAELKTDSPNSEATFIAIPFDVPKVFSTWARVPVRGAINGFAFRSSISPYGGVHYLPVNKALHDGAKVKAVE